MRSDHMKRHMKKHVNPSLEDSKQICKSILEDIINDIPETSMHNHQNITPMIYSHQSTTN